MQTAHKFNSNTTNHINSVQTINSELVYAERSPGSSLISRLASAEALARWEAAAAKSAQQLDEAQRRARTAEAEGEACAAREAALREHV